MQSHDLSPNPCSIDLPTMRDSSPSPIHHSQNSSPRGSNEIDHKDEKPLDNGCLDDNGIPHKVDSVGNSESSKNRSSRKEKEKNDAITFVRRERPTRACTARAAKLYEEQSVIDRKPPKREKIEQVRGEEEEEEEESKDQQGGKIVTQLVTPPPPGQLARWNLRSMWELASIFNFFNIFRPLLNIAAEFCVEELETALITPNSTLGDIHIPLLKAIPPVTRMACGHDTWVTVLCRKLRGWWHWVADGEIPIVASHGAEVEIYKSLNPGIRVVILKALCDIRVEQEDIRNYIEHSIKHGANLSTFRKERIGGDSHGISFWYEDDPIIGHRLYREIRKTDVKKVKMKGSQVLPSTSYEWETLATNVDEFQDVSEKFFSSKNRTEASLGKKLKSDMLPEIEKIHKRKEKLLKKQQRQALLLDNFLNMDGLATGRSLRDRKPVTYTFDDFDRSINEAIKVTKKKPLSPEPSGRREAVARSEPAVNGLRITRSHASHHVSFRSHSPDYDEMEEDEMPEELPQLLDRSDRRRQRPQRYSERDFVAVSDNEVDFDSDDEIVGEAVYDEEYLRQRRQKRKLSSGSEGDEEYHFSEENAEDEEDFVEEDSSSVSEGDDRDGPSWQSKKMPEHTRRGTKLRSVDELQSGLRRSKRSTRNRMNYRQYELSESESEPTKQGKSNRHSDASENEDYSMESQESEGGEDEGREMGIDQPLDGYSVQNNENQSHELVHGPNQNEADGVGERHFLDLNEVAPGPGFDDGLNLLTKNDGEGDL